MDTPTFDDPSQLGRLLGPGRLPGFRLALPGLSAAENARWEAELRSAYFACGCPEGARALILALAGLLAATVLDRIHLVAIPWSPGTIGLMVGAVPAAAVAGKLAGLSRARHRLKAGIACLAKGSISGSPAGSVAPIQ